MKSLVPDALGKGRLDDIINEEMSHINLLSRKLLDVKIDRVYG
jgi:rubrerythrin